MKYKRIISILIILSFCALIYMFFIQKRNYHSMTPQYTKEEGLEFGKEVMKTGSEYSFRQLYFAPIEMVPYSFVMANKYHSADGCWSMYQYIINLFDDNDIEIDSMSESIAMGYLKRGADLKDEWCTEYIISLYQKGGVFFPPDSVLAKYYSEQYEHIKANKHSLNR